jgi:hypothetical protein
MHVTHISIADIPLCIESRLTAGALGLEQRYASFFKVPANAESTVSIRWCEGDPEAVLTGELIFDPGSIWRMYQRGQDFFARLDYYESDRNPEAQAVLQTNPKWNDLVVTERPDGPQWHSLLNVGAGELILRARIIFAQGLVFHAAGLDDNGRGLLFIGHSGAGKSTQTGIWGELPGVVAMNDDRVAMRLRDEGPMIYGTPWGGEKDIAKNHKAPLSAIFVLEQTPENEIKSLPRRTSVPMLLARAFLPFWDPNLLVGSMDILGKLVDRVPVYLLRCRPGPSVIPLVRSVL